MSSRYQAGIVLPGYNALKVANAPTIGTATAGSSLCAAVTFTAPSCVGGGAISSYTVFANCGVRTASGASSPLTVTGLTAGTAYTFKVIATNAYGPSYPSAASNSVTPAAIGQQAYTTAGSYSWVAPAGVTSVSIVAVGGGGSGNRSDQNNSKGGGGGGLGYKNNYSVTAGNSYTVVVGAGGTGYPCVSTVGNSGSNSYFVSTCVVKGGGGIGGSFSPAYSNYGTFTGDGGGNGGGTACAGNQGGGGGGAGGYAGNGSSPSISGGRNPGSNSPGCAGVFGAGGGGGGDFNGNGGGGGGGVGILGQGCSGAGGAAGGNTSTRSGGGGSGGSSGGGVYAYGGFGGAYGGGGGSGGRGGNPCGGRGGVGAVRIIWPGNTRSFPSTCTGNL
jgi:hypothetical protein